MNQRHSKRLAAVAVLAAGLVLGACDEDHVTDVTGTSPALRLIIEPGDALLPGGETEIGDIRIVGFDPAASPDAFSRGEEPLSGYTTLKYGTRTFEGGAFDFRGSALNSLEDPRLPLLQPSEAEFGSFFALYSPHTLNTRFAQGPAWWNLWGQLTGLPPNRTYTVVLARMALDVRGELDHVQRLLGQTVTEPDSLFMLEGTEGGGLSGGNPVNCNSASAGVAIFATRNPAALGFITTNEQGAATIDCLPVSITTSPWWRNHLQQTPPGAADSLPMGENFAGGQAIAGQYNYMLLIEGMPSATNPVPDLNPTVRIQIGPDIDASGNVIPNAFAPFPATTFDPNILGEVPGGANAFGVPGRLELTLANLPVLPSGGYAVWLFDRNTGTYTLAPVKVVTQGEGGPVVGPLTSTFNSPGDEEEFSIVIDDESGVDIGANTQILITVEQDANPTAPTAAGFLSTEFLTEDNELVSNPLVFGTFSATQAPTPFAVGGTGSATFVGDSLVVNLRRLSAPPAGFHYQSYLVRIDNDEIVDQVRLHTLELDALGNAVDAIDEDEVPGGFEAFNTYLVALEPDGMSLLTPAIIQVSENYQDKFPQQEF